MLATYNDGSACLVLTPCGAGMLAVLNADLAASTLPRIRAFVPLLGELVERMLDRGHAGSTAYCGEPYVAHLPANVHAGPALRIVGPGTGQGPVEGRTAPAASGELVSEAAGVVWRWLDPGPPGVYRVEEGATTVFAVAVQTPAEESELERIEPEEIQTRLAAGHPMYCHSALGESEQRDDFWKWCAAACVACLLGEIAALLAFRT